MRNCKDIEYQIIEYIDGTLSTSDVEAVKQHLNACENCKKMEQQYRLLFETIDSETIEYPTAALSDAFEAALNQEALTPGYTNSKRPTKMLQPTFQTIYKVAAILALMLSSYWFGNYNSNKAYIPELTHLKNERQEIKRIAALSLFESESASKRIQAVKFSQELKDPDDAILKALIGEMLNDKMVNVRLASARALQRFSEYKIVKDAYIEALRTENNTSMQIELIEILAHIKEKRAIPQMKELLDDENTPIFIKDQLKTELQNLI
ncbi:MAG: zf-HC2 domain-containing protein [Bacteroidota bacterium]